MTIEVAIVHDYLTQRGGAERVVLSMLRAFPGARLYTSLYEPDGTFPEFRDTDVRMSSLNRFAALRRDHRKALPVLAPVFSATSVEADVVLCSSSGWAHGVRANGRKIVYCYTPARWLYQPDRYLTESGLAAKAILRCLSGPLRFWDKRTMQTADAVLTSSNAVRARIADTYGINATVLAPPPPIDLAGEREAVPGVATGGVLCVSRLLPYKNVEVVIEAARLLPEVPFVVVGSGPDEHRLHLIAPRNVQFLAGLSDSQLRWLYSRCRCLVAAAYEDYGLTPLEAASFGKPSVILRWGGYVDTVADGITGVFFESPTPTAIVAALSTAFEREWDAKEIKRHATAFSEKAFVASLRSAVQPA